MIKIKWDWSLWYVANWFHFQDTNPIQSTRSLSNWDHIDGKLLHSCVLIICSPFGRNRFETLLLCTLLQSACMPHDMSCFHSIVDLVVLETGEFFGQDDRLAVVAFQLNISACSCSKFVRTVVYIYMSTVPTPTFDLTIYVSKTFPKPGGHISWIWNMIHLISTSINVTPANLHHTRNIILKCESTRLITPDYHY